MSTQEYAASREVLGVKDPDAGLFGEVKFIPRPSAHTYGSVDRYRDGCGSSRGTRYGVAGNVGSV